MKLPQGRDQTINKWVWISDLVLFRESKWMSEVHLCVRQWWEITIRGQNESSRREISLRFGPLLNSTYSITKILEANVVSFPHPRHTILLLLLLLRGPSVSSNIIMHLQPTTDGKRRQRQIRWWPSYESERSDNNGLLKSGWQRAHAASINGCIQGPSNGVLW